MGLFIHQLTYPEEFPNTMTGTYRGDPKGPSFHNISCLWDPWDPKIHGHPEVYFAANRTLKLEKKSFDSYVHNHCGVG